MDLAFLFSLRREQRVAALKLKDSGDDPVDVVEN
jgi:hypothetical protein